MSVYIPNGIDLADLHRRLDDMQRDGLDLIVIEKWRAILYGYESVDDLRNVVVDACSALESVADDLGYEPLDHQIDISGTLDDLEGEPGCLSEPARAVIEKAIAKEQKDSDGLAATKASASETALRKAISDLDEASNDPDQMTRAERKAEEERIAKAKAARAKADKKIKVTLNPARAR